MPRKKPAKKFGAQRPAEVMAAPMYKPPTPDQMLEGSVRMASRDAAMAHPAFQRLHKGIHAKMMKAAKGQGFNGPGVARMRGM